MLFLSFPEVQSKTCPKSFGQSSWKTHGCMLDEPCFPPTFSKKSKGLSCGNSTLKPLHSRHGYAPDSLENLRTLCLLEMELFRVGYQSEIVRVTLSVLRCREMSWGLQVHPQGPSPVKLSRRAWPTGFRCTQYQAAEPHRGSVNTVTLAHREVHDIYC